jgi:Polyketide cyclase / dehydrase and lipid transport
MNLQQSADIRAEIKSIWATLVDVERWSEWTRSIDKVERLDHGGFGIGSRARVHQPRIPVAVWTVTEFEPGKSFTWVSEAFGIRSFATHRLEPRSDGTVSLTLGFAQTGWLARLVRSRAEKIAREYLALEAQGLKRRCEG